MAKLSFTGPNRESAAESARAAADLAGQMVHVRVIPAEKIIWVLTGDDAPVFDPRPAVSKWQLVQACADAGITEAQIEASVVLLTPKRQRFWKYTQIIDRDNPFSSALRSNLTPVPTPKDWNDIFLRASILDPTRV